MLVYLRAESALTILRLATMRWKLPVPLAISPSHSMLTPSQPVLLCWTGWKHASVSGTLLLGMPHCGNTTNGFRTMLGSGNTTHGWIVAVETLCWAVETRHDMDLGLCWARHTDLGLCWAVETRQMDLGLCWAVETRHMDLGLCWGWKHDTWI